MLDVISQILKVQLHATAIRNMCSSIKNVGLIQHCNGKFPANEQDDNSWQLLFKQSTRLNVLLQQSTKNLQFFTKFIRWYVNPKIYLLNHIHYVPVHVFKNTCIWGETCTIFNQKTVMYPSFSIQRICADVQLNFQ